jgi:hypothetical protein
MNDDDDDDDDDAEACFCFRVLPRCSWFVLCNA